MKISIITPFYEGNDYIDNYLKMIHDNLRSLSDEDDAEVIMVNDSPWCTPVTADGLELTSSDAKAKYPRLKILVNEKNQGIQSSRINGIKASSADYIIMLDQDDLLESYALAHLIKCAKANTDAQIIIANARLHQKDSAQAWYRSDYHKSKLWDLETYLTIGTQIISPGQCLIKKDAIPDFWMTHICSKNGADDYFLWLLMLAAGAKHSYLDEITYNHVYTAKNLSADTTVTDTSSFEFIEFLYECDFFKNEDADLLRKMLNYKAAFRAGGKFAKIKESLKNFDLFRKNLKYKKQTKTPYGFNR